MIDLAILGVLAEHDLHGYEIRKRLEELLGSRLAVSFGSIYPALARLERKELVKAVTYEKAPLPATPMSGSLTGELAAFRVNPSSLDEPKRGSRGKKVYGITTRGRERLHELLVDPVEVSHREFAVRIAFCHYLAPTERLGLFERRRTELVEQRQQRRRARRAGAPETGGPNRYLRSLIEHETEVASADLAWLDRLIEAERTAVTETPHETPGGEPQS